MSEESKSLRLFNMPWQIFAVFAAIVLVATYMGVLPKGMIGAFPFMIVVGAVLNEIGNRCPIVNTYLGGGAIVIIFGMAALCYYHLIPDATVKIVTNFMKGEGFLDFYIAALICGSILGMNRDLLIRAAIRYLPAIVGGVVVALGLAGLVGELTGYGAKQAILYIAVPIMGGGMGAGAVPLSKIFGETLAQKPEDIINIMIPAVALGNAMAIVAGGLLSKLGKTFPSLTGNGDLLIAKGADDTIKADEEFLKKRDAVSLTVMGVGLLLATAFFAWGRIIAFFIPKRTAAQTRTRVYGGGRLRAQNHPYCT